MKFTVNLEGKQCYPDSVIDELKKVDSLVIVMMIDELIHGVSGGKGSVNISFPSNILKVMWMLFLQQLDEIQTTYIILHVHLLAVS